MKAEDKQKLFDICCRGKRGEYLPSEAIKFCEKMLEEYPDEYKAMQKDVFEATKPYGSDGFV